MSGPLKILHVSRLYSYTGGIETYVRNVTTHLARRGHEVTVLAEGPKPGFENPSEVRMRWLPAGRRLFGRYAYPVGLLRALREAGTEADVIHAHQSFSLSTVAASFVPRPRVVSHYLHPQPPSRLRQQRRHAQLSVISKRFNRVVLVSEAEGDLLLRDTGREWRATVCHPGFDEFGTGGRHPASQDTGAYVVSLGRLTTHKRHALAIQAVGRLPGRVHLEVIGDGPEAPALEIACRRAGLDPVATIVGRLPREELAVRLRRWPVYLALSTEESFGIALAEAIGAGCIPIASDIPSHREIIELSGWGEANLVPVDVTALQLERRIAHWIGPDADKRAPVRLPTWDDTAATLEGVYREVIAGRGR